MIHEQSVYRKKILRMDGILLLSMILVLAIAVILLQALAHVLPEPVAMPFQYAAFFVLLAACYLLVMRQFTSYRYVLTEECFTVYRVLGKNERTAARVNIADILFVAPYPHPAGEKGRERAFCEKNKRSGIIIAYDSGGQRQWLIISPDTQMLGAINHAVGSRNEIHG